MCQVSQDGEVFEEQVWGVECKWDSKRRDAELHQSAQEEDEDALLSMTAAS